MNSPLIVAGCCPPAPPDPAVGVDCTGAPVTAPSGTLTVPHPTAVQLVKICDSERQEIIPVCLTNDGGATKFQGISLYTLNPDGTFTSALYIGTTDVTATHTIIECDDQLDSETETICVDGRLWTKIIVMNTSVVPAEISQITWIDQDGNPVAAPAADLMNNANCNNTTTIDCKGNIAERTYDECALDQLVELNSSIDTLIESTDAVERGVGQVLGALTADCPGINTTMCNTEDITDPLVEKLEELIDKVVEEGNQTQELLQELIDCTCIPPVVTDLTLTKVSDKTNYKVGDPITWTIVATNNGPDAVTGASVKDTFPSGVSGLSWSSVPSGGGSSIPNAGTSNIDASFSGPAGATVTYTVTGTVTADGDITNTASITPPVGVTDPNPNTNTGIAPAISTPITADLYATKTMSPNPVNIGQQVTYVITVGNNGPDAVTGASVVDNFPASVTGVTWTASGGVSVPSAGNGNINAAVNLAAGQVVTYTATGTVTEAGNLMNTATITPPAGVVDPVTTNNTGLVTGSVLDPQADMSIVKTMTPNPVKQGDQVTVTIVVTNNSTTQPVNGATVVDNFPAGMTAVTWTSVATGGATGNEASGTGNINDVVDFPPSSSVTYTALATVNDLGALSNTSSVTMPAGITDPTEGNNTSNAVVNVVQKQADIAVTKTTVTPVTLGGNMVYTITYTNNGPDAANGMTATDSTLPATATWSAAFTGGATGNASGSGAINEVITTMPSGATVVYTVTVPATAVGTFVNTAGVTMPPNVVDPNGGNNTGTAITTVSGTVAKRVIKPQGVVTRAGSVVTQHMVGDTITWTVTVQNTGSLPISPETLTDSMGTVTPASIASIPVGGSGTFTVTRVLTQADIDAGQVENTATATGGGVTQPSQPSPTDPVGPTTTPLNPVPACTTEGTVPSTAVGPYSAGPCTGQATVEALETCLEAAGYIVTVTEEAGAPISAPLTFSGTTVGGLTGTAAGVGTVSVAAAGTNGTTLALAGVGAGANLTGTDGNLVAGVNYTVTNTSSSAVAGAFCFDPDSNVGVGATNMTSFAITFDPTKFTAMVTGGIIGTVTAGTPITSGVTYTTGTINSATAVTGQICLTPIGTTNLAVGEATTIGWTQNYNAAINAETWGFNGSLTKPSVAKKVNVQAPAGMAAITGINYAGGNTAGLYGPCNPIPAIALNKTYTVPAGTPTPIPVGTIVTFNFGVTNTTGATVTGASVSDPMVSATPIAVTPSTLAPGQTGVATGTHKITVADAANQPFTNTATASATHPQAGVLTATDSVTVPIDCLWKTGAWTIVGNTATDANTGLQVVLGTNMTMGVQDTLNPTAAFFTDNMAGRPSLTILRENPPNTAGGYNIILPTGTTGVTMHVDRLGGQVTAGATSTSNTSIHTFGAGVTTTELAQSSASLVTGANSFQRQPNVVITAGSEATANPLVGTAAGSIQLNNVTSGMTIPVTTTVAGPTGDDGVEIAFSGTAC